MSNYNNDFLPGESYKIKMAEEVKDVFSKNRFHKVYFESKYYKEIFCYREAFFSIIITLVINLLLYQVLKYSVQEYFDLAKNILQIVIPGILSIISLTIAGVAIVLTTIQNDLIYKLADASLAKKEKGEEHHNKALKSLKKLIFNFYVVGMYSLLLFILLLCTYIVLSIKMPINMPLLFNLQFFSTYFTIFVLLRNVMLIGTCIRLRFIKYNF